MTRSEPEERTCSIATPPAAAATRASGRQLEPQLRSDAGADAASGARPAAARADRLALQPALHGRAPRLARASRSSACGCRGMARRRRAWSSSRSRTCRPRCGSRCVDLRRQIGPDQPIYMVGYSNGAALAVDYTRVGARWRGPADAGRARAGVAGDRRSRGSPSWRGRGPGSRRCPGSSGPRGSSHRDRVRSLQVLVVQFQCRRRDAAPDERPCQAGREACPGQADRRFPAGACVPVHGRLDREGGGRGRCAARASRARPATSSCCST